MGHMQGMEPLPHHRCREAFEVLYRTHYGAVARYVQRRCPEDEVNDVVAETFTTAWRKLDDALDGGLPWLYRTAAWTLQNSRRAGDRRDATLHLLKTLASTTAAESPDLRAEYADLVAALGSLSVTDREVVYLAYWEQLEPRHIAQVMGCTSATAAVRLHRARRRLQRAFTTAPGSTHRHTPDEVTRR